MKTDPVTRALYSCDASIYEIEPMGVVFPRSRDEVVEVVKMGHPIVPRGAATGVTGGCIGSGVVVDLSRHMRKILEIDAGGMWVRCQPGIILDEIEKAAKPYGLTLGLNISTGNRATVGGSVANSAAGSHGRIADRLLGVEVVLADGSVTRLEEGPLVDKLKAIGTKYAAEIEADFPKINRRASGYNLDQLDKPHKLIAGSEGSLGVITEVTLELQPIEKSLPLTLIAYDSVEEAMEAIPNLLKSNPRTIELIDGIIIAHGRTSPSMKGRLEWLEGEPQALLVVENGAGTITDEATRANIWALRKAGLGLLLSRRTYSRAIAFIEDLTVPPEQLAPFVVELKAILAGFEVGLYGHASQGCLHIRPFVDLRTQSGVMKEILIKATALVRRYGGVLSGEHGDGLPRSWLNPDLFGTSLYHAFLEIKDLFDPDRRMNPGKVVEGPDPTKNLRKSPPDPSPYPFAFDVNMCNGNGACRKTDGLMCPSYHATRDERDTTRARAQELRAVVNGLIPPSAETLDLCLECKGCKTECPSQVDMARIKSEMLHHLGVPLRGRLIGNIATLYRLGAPVAPLTNWLSNTSLAKKIAGIHPDRRLPKLHRPKKLPTITSKPDKVILFLDTFTRTLYPDLATKTITLLQRLDIEPIIPPYQCCGRPLISKGLLPQAKKTMNRLLPHLDKGLPIIGLEPSCLFTIADHLPVQTLEEFLTPYLKDHTFPPSATHIHCHQKALVGPNPTQILLPNTQIIQSTCCGLAGSFGYEKNHHDLSLQIAETALFPAIRSLAPNTPLIANGTSCRCQITHSLPNKPLHLVEFLLTHL